MKYEIIKNGIDDYTLKYKDKEFNFHADINLIKRIQSANQKAKVRMIMDLSKEGISLKDFTIEEKKDGKTYMDNTNKTELINAYVEEETTNVFNDICKEKFGNDLIDLIQDIGLEENEIEKFSRELSEAILGKTPSQKK